MIAESLKIRLGTGQHPVVSMPFHPYGDLRVVNVPHFLWDKNGSQQMREKTAQATQKELFNTKPPSVRDDSSQQEASSSGIPPQGS
jgi:hypothetical protein